MSDSRKALIALNSTLHDELLNGGLVTAQQWNQAIAPRLATLTVAVLADHEDLYETGWLRKLIDDRLKYWLCHDLKSGWTTIGPCCDKCRLTNPQGNMARLCGCRDPFQIECECHLPARKAVKDYMIQELTAILKDSK